MNAYVLYFRKRVSNDVQLLSVLQGGYFHKTRQQCCEITRSKVPRLQALCNKYRKTCKVYQIGAKHAHFVWWSSQSSLFLIVSQFVVPYTRIVLRSRLSFIVTTIVDLLTRR